ncbi:LOW QUALITY PROTEIN: hydroxyproline dehydrogenase [Struthio camelus]|uniref:LOW QUALITY PROTEIN: hydroxyproline dehydrogenase n=1 Tax=Struthio camelus TaxID=8801 RepID=UPI0036040F00
MLAGGGARWARRAAGRGAGGCPPPAHLAPSDFEDGAAFRLKSGRELARALLVLRLCAAPGLVRHAGTVLAVGRRALGARLWGGLLRASLYGQFVGGGSPGELAAAAGRLRALGLRPMLALPLEDAAGRQREDEDGERRYETNLAAALGCAELAAATGPRAMMQLKVTALMSARLCETVSQRLAEPGTPLSPERLAAVMAGEEPTFACLSPAENRHLGAALRRLDAVAQRAADGGVRVLLDAELAHLNPALSLAALALAARHNGAEPWVWNTYQAYLQDGPARMAADAEAAAGRGLCFGVKLVRGAYLEQERRRARERGAPDPLQPTRQRTDSSYRRCLDLGLELAARRGPRFGLMVASHNEESVLHAARRMEELGIPRPGPSVCFGQLLGMCDHVSLALGRAGYAVYKSVPYGAPEEVLPYLVRRAQENQSVLQGVRRERQLLRRELRRRLLRRP